MTTAYMVIKPGWEWGYHFPQNFYDDKGLAEDKAEKLTEEDSNCNNLSYEVHEITVLGNKDEDGDTE